MEDNKWNLQFNDYALSEILYIEDDEFVEFYNLEVARKLIDYQFSNIKNFLAFMFKFYVFGFVVPFVLTLTVEWVLLLNILYDICLFNQLFFISFEVIQLKYQKHEYFLDPFNVNDFSQFGLFAFLYFYKMLSQFDGDSYGSMIIQAIVLIQCFYKMFYFLRIYEPYMFLLTMSYRIICKCIPFFIFVIGCYIFIAKIEQSLQFGVWNTGD